MTDNLFSLIRTSLNIHWWFFFISLGFAIILRFIATALKAWERRDRFDKSCWWNFKSCYWKYFKGWGSSRDEENDYLHPSIIGFFELVAYPILMAVNKWEFIGAWVTLKTVAEWQAWTKERRPFNRFLIGNALVILIAFLIALLYIYPNMKYRMPVDGTISYSHDGKTMQLKVNIKRPDPLIDKITASKSPMHIKGIISYNKGNTINVEVTTPPKPKDTISSSTPK